MYLRHTTVRKNGKTHSYWRLVRSVRRGRRVAQETVAQLGELDGQGRARAGALALRITGRGKSSTSCLRRRGDNGASRLRCGWTRFVWSAPAVLATCGWAGGCGAPLLSIVSARTAPGRRPRAGAVAGDRGDPRDCALYASRRASCTLPRIGIAARGLTIFLACRPSASTMTGSTARSSACCRTSKPFKTHLKERLGALFDLDYELLLYDETSTYSEGQAEGNGLARRGYSRDHRGDCKQVCIGLVVTRDGVPLGNEAFAGNRTDVTTVEEIVTTMERRYGQARRAWVMDCGMASA